jgi:hypothetical protein
MLAIMTTMSFSFYAEGTREECIAKLGITQEMSSDGQVARGLVLAFLVDAPASASMPEPRPYYRITAYGHRDPHRGSPPSLTISLGTFAAEEAPDAGRHKAAAADM